MTSPPKRITTVRAGCEVSSMSPAPCGSSATTREVWPGASTRASEGSDTGTAKKPWLSVCAVAPAARSLPRSLPRS